MEVALRRRLEGVADIAISQSRQTALVTFTAGPHVFSPRTFRDAVDETGVEVLTFRIDACGIAEHVGSERWFVAGKNRFLLAEGATVPAGDRVCVSGRLDDTSTPARLEVASVKAVPRAR